MQNDKEDKNDDLLALRGMEEPFVMKMDYLGLFFIELANIWLMIKMCTQRKLLLAFFGGTPGLLNSLNGLYAT